jgi:GLPGLI family protein
MKIKSRGIYGLFIAIIFAASCSPKQSGRNSEGSITFKVQYLDNKNTNPMITFLPDNIILNFKDNRTQSSIKGFAGMFEINYVSDLNTKKGFSTLRILGKKYIYEFDLKDAVGYENMKDLTIKQTDDSKEICGFKCKKAVGTSAAFGNQPFDIYYTDEIKISDPNINGPFKDIKGVLLAFSANMNNINMSMTAQKVEEIKIDDEIFNKPTGYTSVTKEEMLNILNEFNSKKSN